MKYFKKVLLFISLLSFTLTVVAQLPEFTMVLYDTSAINGYFFFAVDGHPVITDKFGSIIYYSVDEKGYDCDFKLEVNGKMSYPRKDENAFMIMDSMFRIVDSVSCRNHHTDFHSFKILANGHYLITGVDSSRADLSAFNWTGEDGTGNGILLSGIIQEQDARKKVVFEWNAKKYFALNDKDTFPYAVKYKWPYYDWTHFNSVETDEEGNILLSSRNLNEITKISRKNGSIIWRFGGGKNQFRFINSPVPFYGQRSVRLTANGHLLLFDGGLNVNSHGARAMEFELNEKDKTASLVWSYTYDTAMYSNSWGNVERLDKYNTLVNFGMLATNPVSFVIVNKEGNLLFEMKGQNIFRVHNYATLPFGLHRPHIVSFDSSGHTYLDAGAGYASYQWNTGETSRVISTEKNKKYQVFVPRGAGGLISSENFVVGDTGVKSNR